jgi:hypothetical protein
MRFAAGRFDLHAQTIQAQGRQLQSSVQLLNRALATQLETEHQSIVRDVLFAGDFWGGSGSVACQEFITQLGRNFQLIYERLNDSSFRSGVGYVVTTLAIGNIVNMLSGVRDGLVRDANNYDQAHFSNADQEAR